MTFDGHEVEFRKVDGDVLIHCKKVTGTYSQAKAFLDHSNFTNVYPFGVKTTEPAHITVVPGNKVRIACLTDTRAKFEELFEEAKKIHEGSN